MATEIITHEYSGVEIPQRTSDDYVNLTALTQSEGKLIGHYLENKTTKQYLDSLSQNIGIPISKLVEVNSGRGSHTWGHPEVAMDVAQWVSIPCRIWANRTLVSIVRHGVEQSRAELEEVIAPKPKGLTFKQGRDYKDFLIEIGLDRATAAQVALDQVEIRYELPTAGIRKVLPQAKTAQAGMCTGDLAVALGLVGKPRSLANQLHKLMESLGWLTCIRRANGSVKGWQPTEFLQKDVDYFLPDFMKGDGTTHGAALTWLPPMVDRLKEHVVNGAIAA